MHAQLSTTAIYADAVSEEEQSIAARMWSKERRLLRIAVDERNRRWCSDGFEIGCDNGERVRVAFALDCCDREAMSFLATTGGIAGEDVRDLMVAAVRYPTFEPFGVDLSHRSHDQHQQAQTQGQHY